MSTIWKNYHDTRTVEPIDHRRFNADGALVPKSTTTGQELLALSSAGLYAHVRDAAAARTSCGLIGKAWSFSSLTGNAMLQLECGGKLGWEPDLVDGSGLVGIVPFRAAELYKGSSVDPSRLAWVRGGTPMRDIALWAERNGLSLPTSGDQLGPSLAGAIATGTHGSRLGYGGVQNMVRGIHLITDARRSVWVEPKSRPVLAHSVAAYFADQVIRDDEHFSNALVHLGAMGIVNGAIIEFEPKQLFAKDVPILKLEALWKDWLAAVQGRRFADAGQLLGADVDPVFYEFSLNPSDPRGEESVHIFYSPTEALVETDTPGRTPRPADAVIAYFQRLKGLDVLPGPTEPDLPALYLQLVRRKLRQEAQDYPRARPWSLLHDTDQGTGGGGALYNAGFAIPFARLTEAIEVMCTAVAGMGPGKQFIFTYRFVSNARGGLAHLRWPESVAIELDGASDNALEPYGVRANSLEAVERIQRAFQRAKIEFCMHWAKLGNSPAIVTRNFGTPAQAGTALGKWNRTRSTLLTADGKERMRNQMLVDYRIV